MERCLVLLEWIRKFDLRKAGICSVAAGGINIIVHSLVIANMLSYLWVNGGRSESLAAARQISMSSILLTILNILIALIASLLGFGGVAGLSKDFAIILLVIAVILAIVGFLSRGKV